MEILIANVTDDYTKAAEIKARERLKKTKNLLGDANKDTSTVNLEEEGLGGDKKNRSSKKPFSFDEYLSNLQKETQLLKLTIEQRKLYNDVVVPLGKLSPSKSITESQAKLVLDELEKQKAYAAGIDIAKEYQTAEESLQEQIDELDFALKHGTISLELYQHALRETTGGYDKMLESIRRDTALNR